MKKIIVSLFMVGIFSNIAFAKNIEQTICFSKSDCSVYGYGKLGENVKLCGGKCNGKTLPQMNRDGWRLIQVVSGLQSAFGMVFIKEK